MSESEKNELVRLVLSEQTNGTKDYANSNVFQSGKNFGLRLAARVIEKFYLERKNGSERSVHNV